VNFKDILRISLLLRQKTVIKLSLSKP